MSGYMKYVAKLAKLCYTTYFLPIFSDLLHQISSFCPDACRSFDHFDTWTFHIIGLRTLLWCRRLRCTLAQSEQFGTDERTVLAAKLIGQALHEGIVGCLSLAIVGIGATGLEAGKDKHATCGSTGLAHATNTSTKRSRHLECLLLGVSILIGKSCRHGLRTVVSHLEEFNSASNSLFIIHSYKKISAAEQTICQLPML